MQQKITIKGTIMPKQEDDKKNEICIRRQDGYKMGIKLRENINIEEIDKLKNQKLKEEKNKITYDITKPKVLIISTGGTIASKIDYKTGAVIAKFTANDLVEKIPELINIAQMEAINVFNEMSENFTSSHWQKIAEVIYKNINREKISGIILMQGTDTLSYTASALSFLLNKLGKPVCIVGSQRSIDRGSSDAFMNLVCASHFAISDFAGVFCIMHATMNDDFCFAIRGTRVKKMHSSRRDAFKSINEMPIAKIYPKGNIQILNKKYNKRNNNLNTELNGNLNPEVMLIKTYPGLNPNIIDFAIEKKIKGIVLEGTGLGHCCTKGKNNFLPFFEKCKKKNIPVIMTTQTIYGRVNAYVYSALRILEKAGLIYAEDMISEVAYIKLKWVLSQENNLNEVKKLMLINVADEISERSEII